MSARPAKTAPIASASVTWRVGRVPVVHGGSELGIAERSQRPCDVERGVGLDERGDDGLAIALR